MDATAQRARDREAFREFLAKHRYAPQGRFARVGALEEKDLDALGRGTLGPVWAWAWQNIKNADDMDTIKRNVNVARYSIDSSKQEREQAKAKREALVARKGQLEEALRSAREREQALLANVRGLEHEQGALVQTSSDKKQRELLRRAFNHKNDEAVAQWSDTVDQVQWLATAAETTVGTASDNQVDVLLAEVKRMLKSAKNAENVDFGDSDIHHLRESSGAALASWLLEAASRPHDDVPDDTDDAKYAAHVEEHSSSSHDALVQIQNLLRRSQAEHIASFVKTQKLYVKANELKQRVDEALAPDDTTYGLWGNGNTDANGNGESALAAETVDLQIQSQANAVALNCATRAYEDVGKQVDAHRQLKQELENKIELMNQFDERQQDIVAQIRSKFRHNQELLQSLSHKQSRLLQIVTDETRPRMEQDSDELLATWSRLMLDELRAFRALRLGRLDTAQTKLAVSPDAITEHARQAFVAVPFEELYINQIQDSTAVDTSLPTPQRPQDRNGYQRIARALGVAPFKSWASILASLQELEGDNTATATEVREAIQLIERDIAEDRSQTIPEAQVLLTAMHQVTEAMTTASLSRLKDVVQGNTETMQRSIPELDQAIDDWYNQPAWTARLERDSATSDPLSSHASTAMAFSDLLK